MKILKAGLMHLDDLSKLFDCYRVFYKQDSNINAAKKFLVDRMTKNDSIIYISYIEERPVGFTQLYPLLSSVSMEPMYLLNDLYVDKDFRGKGIGEALIQKAKRLCHKKKLKGLAIQTGLNNPAQCLYERLGFIKETDLHFFWNNNA